MGIKRRKGSFQKAKKPILINSLKKIINVIDKQKKEEIKKIRDRSIILKFNGICCGCSVNPVFNAVCCIKLSCCFNLFTKKNY